MAAFCNLRLIKSDLSATIPWIYPRAHLCITCGNACVMAADAACRCDERAGVAFGHPAARPGVAIYSLQVKVISRSAGRSVVAAAAYRAGEKIGDDRLGVVWDFTAKRGVLHTEIVAPDGAPEWVKDRGELWNAAERAEDKSTRRSSAATGRDIILALPHELTHEQRVEAVREYATWLTHRYGVAVDFAIHAPDRHSDDRNYHAHLLMTTRRIGPTGFGAKTRELDDFKTGPGEIETMRRSWERIGNQALERAGLDIRIDCRSFADQGLDREATVHLGPVASAMERNGDATDLGDRNRAAQARNDERNRLRNDKASVSAEIIDLAAERARREAERELRAAVRTQSPPRILDTLTERRATFSRGDLNRVLAKVITDPKERTALTDRILALPDVIGLKETAEAPVSRYTTRAVLQDEGRILEDAATLAARRQYEITRPESWIGAATSSAGHRGSARRLLPGRGGRRICRDRRRSRYRQEHDPGGGARRLRSFRLPGHRHGLDQCRRAEPQA